MAQSLSNPLLFLRVNWMECPECKKEMELVGEWVARVPLPADFEGTTFQNHGHFKLYQCSECKRVNFGE